MDNKLNKSHIDDHDGPPQDEVTKNKIDKHLSDIDDTISEEDMKNINTSTGPTKPVTNHAHDKEEADEILKDGKNEPDPDREAPTPWEILGS